MSKLDLSNGPPIPSALDQAKASKEKHPSSVPALLASLRSLEEAPAKPKPVKSTQFLYPASLYASIQPEASSSTSPPKDRLITSWKMNEFMYRKADNPFPTLARGLFTEESKGNDGEIEDKIVARGYDKFFNIDEVAWTYWDAMKIHTDPPYHLTLKSNGCLILISALSPDHLIVASKHSLGTTIVVPPSTEETPVDGTVSKAIDRLDLGKEEAQLNTSANGASDNQLTYPTESAQSGTSAGKSKNQLKKQLKMAEKQTKKISPNLSQKQKGKGKADEEEEDEGEAVAHAEVGRQWLQRTLAKSGRTEQELARRLWNDKLSAVLELCDDSFEEHVIATPEHWTGLHLHGLNHNTPHFSTLPPDQVTSFAEEFGFIPTKHIQFDTLESVKTFTDDIARSGSWEGDTIEGFVVRCTVTTIPTDDEDGRPPYRPGAPFFFKIKFEEPYLLYRTWREMTKRLLPLLDAQTVEAENAVWDALGPKIRRPEVGVYAEWCGELMKSEPSFFDNYEKRGVVKVRDRFLAWTEGEGKDIWKKAQESKWKFSKDKLGRKKVEPQTVDRSVLPKKWLLVPMAVPGCGKTLIGVALSKLFGIGHTQSDDVTTKKTAPTFLKNIATLFKSKAIVYADRNNHITKHYVELSELQTKDKIMAPYNLREIAIIWDIPHQPYHRLLRICSERVVTRGENHQTLRPDSTIDAEHEAVVAKFLHDFTEPDPEVYDDIINVKVEDDARTTLGKIVDGLCRIDGLGIRRPEESEIDRALEEARGYQVTTEFHGLPKVGKRVRYFGVAPEIDLKAITHSALDGLSSSSSSLIASAKSFFATLEESSRITTKPHITLSHENNVASEKEASTKAGSTAVGQHEKLWNICKSLAEAKYSPLYTFNMTHLVWDDRVMALVVDRIHPSSETESLVATGATEGDLEMPEEVRVNLHVTVGTRSEDIVAFESRGIIVAARRAFENGGADAGETEEVVEGGGKVRWLRVGPVRGEGRIKGMW